MAIHELTKPDEECLEEYCNECQSNIVDEVNEFHQMFTNRRNDTATFESHRNVSYVVMRDGDETIAVYRWEIDPDDGSFMPIQCLPKPKWPK